MKSLFVFVCAAAGLLAAAPASAAAEGNHCPLAQPSYPQPFDAKLDAMSFVELRRAANRGDGNALALLGLKYTGADSTATDIKPDMKQAIAYFEKAAAKSDALGEYLLGVAYMGGSGVAKDEARAFGLFKRAAAHGHPNGRYWVGEMTAKGRGGVAANWENALPFFVAAAASGATDGYVELGYMYEKGLGGLPVDYQKAAYCYRQGGQLKSQIAQFNLRVLIDQGEVAWQTGDPGEPPKPAEKTYRVK